MPTRITPVFVDCDDTMGLENQEIDDGLTLLYLLGRPSVRLVGVCATHGNGPVAATARQTRELLAAVGEEIPVYDGVDPPVGGSGSGADGAWRAHSPAARALVAASEEYAGRLVVLGLGAMTNLAGAAELDPGFYARLAGVALMGGYLAPLRFPRREVRELNLSSDPAAAHSVLNAACPVTVMSAQLCLAARFGRWDLLTHNRGPSWLRRLVRDWYRAWGRWSGSRGFYLWDLLPAVSISEPDRFAPAWHAIRSTVADLESGRLVLEALGSPVAPGTRVDPREVGVVNVPSRILAPRRLVTECAAGWAVGATSGRPAPRGVRPPRGTRSARNAV